MMRAPTCGPVGRPKLGLPMVPTMPPKFVRLKILNPSAWKRRSIVLSPWIGNFIRLLMDSLSSMTGGLRKSPKYWDALPSSNWPGVENAAALNQRVLGLFGSSEVRSMPVWIGPAPTLAFLNWVYRMPVPIVFEVAWTRMSPPDLYCWIELIVQWLTARFTRKWSVFRNFFPRPNGISKVFRIFRT